MRWLSVLVLVACTEHGKGGGDEWEVRQIAFAEAICQNACVPTADQEQCIVDVVVDMNQARDELPDSGEAACIECMRVKTEAMPEIVANGCEPSAATQLEITTACGDLDEACAGFP